LDPPQIRPWRCRRAALIVPSEGLIVARFGFSQDADGRVSHRQLCRLTAEVINALHGGS
jgi:hypothetical protein